MPRRRTGMKKLVAFLAVAVLALALAVHALLVRGGAATRAQVLEIKEEVSRNGEALGRISLTLDERCDELEAKLDRVEAKLDRVLELLVPALPDNMREAR